MLAQIGVVATVVVHYAVMGYIVFGGFLVWRWLWMAWPHLLVIGWAVLSLVQPTVCPLTAVENYFRRLDGAGGMPIGFIDTYIKGVLYPESWHVGVQIFCGAVVLVSWIGAYLRWRHQHRPAESGPAPMDRIKLG